MELWPLGFIDKWTQKGKTAPGSKGFSMSAVHNPENVGSSAAFATKKVPKTIRFSELFFVYRMKRLPIKVDIFPHPIFRPITEYPPLANES